VCLWAEEGPACDAVSTVPPRREGCCVGGRGAVAGVGVVGVVVVVVVEMLRKQRQQQLRESEVCHGSGS
jgi:hypothetical protein